MPYKYAQICMQMCVDERVSLQLFTLQVHWSLSLSDHLVVALEDASLFQMNVYVNGQDISVHGRRSEVLSPVKVRYLILLPSSDRWQHCSGN